MDKEQKVYKSIDFEITKSDHEEQKVWGIFNMSTKNGKILVDLHDDFIEPEELQKAAHDFVRFFRTAGEGHKDLGVGTLIDSIMMTDEISKAMEDALLKVGVENPVIKPNAEFWFGGFHIERKSTWEAVKEGKFDAFSIGGFAKPEQIDIEDK